MNMIARWIAVAITLGMGVFTPSPVSAATTTNVAAYQAMTLSLNPVAYYKFDESSGPVLDSSVNANNGTIAGTVAQGVSGMVSNGAEIFNYGTISAPDTHVNFDVANAFTLEAWVKVPAGAYCGSITHWDYNQAGYGIYNWGGPMYFYIGDVSGHYAQLTITPRIDDYTWHYVAVTHDAGSVSSAGMHSYIDGLPAAATGAQSPTPFSSFAISTPLVFNYLGNKSSMEWVDEAAIYDTALSSAQIQNHYNSLFVVVPEPGSVALLGLGGLMLWTRRRRQPSSASRIS